MNRRKNARSNPPDTDSPPDSSKTMNATQMGTLYASEGDTEGAQWRRTGLYAVAGTLSALFVCVVCVGIPCFVWNTRRKSRLNLKEYELEHHSVGGYHTRIPSNTAKGGHIHVVDQSIIDEDTIDGIYGPGTTAGANEDEMEMVPINEVDDEFDHFQVR